MAASMEIYKLKEHNVISVLCPVHRDITLRIELFEGSQASTACPLDTKWY